MTKLLIWDLDDTLWRGTLAEGDEVELIQRRADAVRTLNRRGIVNSICSKNDHDTARERLRALDLWDEFVFAEISFSPKGEAVTRIIDDMQLRAADVVFIDDNGLNLREVKFALPDIRVVDASGDEVDLFLDELLAETEGIDQSRVERYRVLEQKRADRTVSDGSNEDFLRSCGIRMTVLERTDNLPYAQRIEELVNRTNQLNYTKSRVETGTMQEHVIASTRNFTYSAFVWDKYGDYGLVGFASVANRRQLEHFLFSCRTMNMGIESALAHVVSQRTFVTEYPVEATLPDWIELVPQDSDEFRAHMDPSVSESLANPQVRVMANCQSAALAHYMGSVRADFDNYPRVFTLPGFHRHEYIPGELAPVVVYGAFVDYDQVYWGGVPDLAEYEAAAAHFTEHCRANGHDLVVILPAERFSVIKEESGQTPERYRAANDIWRQIARESAHVDVLEVDRLIGPDGALTDPRHFDRDLLVGIADRLSEIVAPRVAAL